MPGRPEFITNENLYSEGSSLKRRVLTRLSLRRSKRKFCSGACNSQTIELTNLVTPKRSGENKKFQTSFLAKDLEAAEKEEFKVDTKHKEVNRKPPLKSKSSSSLQFAMHNAKEQALEHVESGISKLQHERYAKLTSTPVRLRLDRVKSKSSHSRSSRKRPFQNMWNAVRRRVLLLRNSHQTLEETASPCRRYLDGSVVSHTGLDGELPVYKIETPYQLRSRTCSSPDHGIHISP